MGSSAPTDLAILATDEVSRSLRSRTLHLAAPLLVMTAAFVLAKTGRDALFFQGRGVFDLPRAYIGIAVLSLPMAACILALMHLCGPRQARVLAPLGIAAVLAAYAFVARPGGGTLMTFFFMFVPLVFGVLFSLSWLLAAELLDGATRFEQARAYSVVGAASMLGGVAGGALAKLLAMRIEPRVFIFLGAVTLATAAVLLALAHARFPMRRAESTGRAASFQFADCLLVLRQPYSTRLLVTAVLAALVGILVEFQFYLAAATSGQTGRQSAGFFASFYLILNGIALALQLALMPRLQKRFGVYGSLLVLPAALLGGTAVLLANASIALRSLLRLAEGGLKSSIHRANWEQAYLPLSSSQRAIAKLLVDGAGARVGEGLAAVGLYAWLRFEVGDGPLLGRSTAWVTWALFATILIWVLSTRGLGARLAAAAENGALSEMRLDIPLPDT